MNSQIGFLLSYLKYGDNDAILHCFTQKEGYKSFFSRGIYSARNKKKPYLFPLNELCLTLTAQKGSMENVSRIDLQKNRDFYSDIKSSTIVFFVSDFLNQLLRNEEQNEIIYNQISVFLHELEQKNHQCHLLFLIKMVQIQGFSPLLSTQVYLNPQKGIFENTLAHPLFTQEISSLWKLVLQQENPYSIRINSSDRKSFLDSILVYYQHHFTDFRIPNSLEIVQQIFE